MSETAPKSERRRYRARLRSRHMFLLLESVAIVLLVAGVLWLVQNHTRRGPFSSGLSDLRLWPLIVLASGLGTAGSLIPYYVGRRGTEAVFERYPQIEGKQWDRIEAAFQRWGSRTLLLSGIPTLGFALLVAAGVFAIQRNAFILWVFLGKALRNALLAVVFLLGIELIL